MATEQGDWTVVGGLDAVPDGESVRLQAFGIDVLVMRSSDTIHAVANRCTHQGAPLDRGVVKANDSVPTVTCPAHGSVFSLVDGRVRRGPASAPLQAFEARVNQNAVELRPRD